MGDRLEIHRGDEVFTIFVEALSNQRGPAQQAQTLYRETEESRLAREALKQRREIAAEPASFIKHGRPTKKEGRELRRSRRLLKQCRCETRNVKKACVFKKEPQAFY